MKRGLQRIVPFREERTLTISSHLQTTPIYGVALKEVSFGIHVVFFFRLRIL